MKQADVFPSKYVSTPDLKGKPVVVTVRSVVMDAVDGENKPQKPVVYFVGSQKGMVLNQTNWAACAIMFGDESDNWVGCRIELFPDTTLFQGKNVPCIRMRGPTTAPAPLPPDAAMQGPQPQGPRPGQSGVVTLDDQDAFAGTDPSDEIPF